MEARFESQESFENIFLCEPNLLLFDGKALKGVWKGAGCEVSCEPELTQSSASPLWVPVPLQLLAPSLGLACISKDVLVQLDAHIPKGSTVTPIKEFICQDTRAGSRSKAALTEKGWCCCVSMSPLRLFCKTKGYVEKSCFCEVVK